MTSRNKREGKFLGYTCRYCWTPKGKLKWVTYYCRGTEGLAHIAIMKPLTEIIGYSAEIIR